PTQRAITALTAAEHHPMPAHWIKKLHHAALRLSSSQCLELIEQLPGSLAPLAQVLTEWVDRFQFEAIVEWVESRMLHDSEPGGCRLTQSVYREAVAVIRASAPPCIS
ncbi:hypothetical protein C7B61_19555, partial [filamentous cyanobacterium CCP1]